MWFADVEDYAFGELGLLPAEFYDLTWSQYQRYALGYQIRQDKEWIRTANVMWAAITPHTKRQVTPASFYRSIFDTSVEEITEQEYEETCKAWGL